RLRPPYPAQAGLYGLPTVVNNVETLATVPWLVRHGAEAFAARGTAASPGTKALCLNRGFARPGLVEVDFGTLLRTVVEDAGGGRDGQAIAALLLGGPMGCVVDPEHWDAPVCYGALAERGLQLGHGGLVALPEGADLAGLIHHWLEFMADESCGKCVPCRAGSRRARDLAAKQNGGTAELRHWLEVVAAGSLCAFGQLIPPAVLQLLDRLEAEGGAR
ncbi:MAG: protein disulfide oxidoreductase, partial [Armatimonadetes bacterium]|nr:protein disulfide oxidoreductase [Armatimonadota bacterium]